LFSFSFGNTTSVDFYLILLLHLSAIQDSLQNVAFQYPAPGCIQIKVMGGYLTPVTGCVMNPQKPPQGQKYIEQGRSARNKKYLLEENASTITSVLIKVCVCNSVVRLLSLLAGNVISMTVVVLTKHANMEYALNSDRDCPRYMLCRRNRCVPERDHREKEREKFCPGRRRPYFKGNHPLSCDPRVTIDMCPKGFYCDRKTSYCCEDYTEDEYDSEGTLGKSCSTVADCNVPYAQCAKGECTCRSGYLLDVDTCKPQVYNCPTGAPIVINNKVVQCTVQFFPDREDPEDSCPENTFCVSYGSPPVRNRHKRSSTLAEGFCCPKINSICPVGAPHHCPNDDCQRHCPKNTHFCHKSGGYEWKEVCCDKPCLNGDVFENGQCVPERSSRRFFGGLRCSTAADCRASKMVCRNNDKELKCPVGKPQKTENGKFVYCNESCSNKEYYCDQQLHICCSRRQGEFGAVYCVQDLKRPGKNYALKAELRNQRNAVLKMDTLVLLKLRGKRHVCQFIRCGRNETINYLVMALVGSNLDVLRKSMPEKRFSLGTVCKIAIQCTEALRDLHTAGFIHRDIKPTNIAVGINSERNIIKILDFGLARKFCDGDGVIRPPREKPGFRGTVLYASINAHKDLELGRQDDFFSTYYTIMEFLSGSLSWENCCTLEEVQHAKEQLPNVMNEQLPKPLNGIYKHLETLNYHTEPNYKWIISQFEQCAIESDINLDDPFSDCCPTWKDALGSASKHRRRPVMQVTLAATVTPVSGTPAEEDVLRGYRSSDGSMVESAINL
ncbi:Tau-tubulin kinase 1, partial [Trichinella zimbabwensis]